MGKLNTYIERLKQAFTQVGTDVSALREDKADKRLSNVANDLSTAEKSAIQSKLGISAGSAGVTSLAANAGNTSPLSGDIVLMENDDIIPYRVGSASFGFRFNPRVSFITKKRYGFGEGSEIEHDFIRETYVDDVLKVAGFNIVVWDNVYQNWVPLFSNSTGVADPHFLATLGVVTKHPVTGKDLIVVKGSVVELDGTLCKDITYSEEPKIYLTIFYVHEVSTGIATYDSSKSGFATYSEILEHIVKSDTDSKYGVIIVGHVGGDRLFVDPKYL